MDCMFEDGALELTLRRGFKELHLIGTRLSVDHMSMLFVREILTLSRCGLSDEHMKGFVILPTLKDLCLSENNIQSVSFLDHAHHLHRISMSSNPVIALPKVGVELIFFDAFTNSLEPPLSCETLSFTMGSCLEGLRGSNITVLIVECFDYFCEEGSCQEFGLVISEMLCLRSLFIWDTALPTALDILRHVGPHPSLVQVWPKSLGVELWLRANNDKLAAFMVCLRSQAKPDMLIGMMDYLS